MSRRIISGQRNCNLFNQSPDKLDYIWLQLDENIHNPASDNNTDNTSKVGDKVSNSQIMNYEPGRKMEGYGVNLTKITDASGKELTYTVVQTMMRIDLPTPLAAGQQFVFKIDWNYKINNKAEIGGPWRLRKTFRKMATICIPSRNGTRAWLCTAILKAGSITSLQAVPNLL
jgi:hypothetical protein